MASIATDEFEKKFLKQLSIPFVDKIHDFAQTNNK